MDRNLHTYFASLSSPSALAPRWRSLSAPRSWPASSAPHCDTSTPIKSGEPVDVGRQMFLNTMNVLTSTMWGSTIGSENERAAVGREFRLLVGEITGLLG
ncbi:hypothetical protein EJB05_17315, partial [Eragrostis curvula]